jgi:ABC-type multidrug transport system fused ATPase/permease subunit
MLYFGHPLYAVACIALILAENAAWFAGVFWLAIWVEAYDRQQAVNIALYLGVYIALAVTETLMYGSTYLMFESGAWRAARKLHRDFVSAVVGVPLSWFKTMPVGRVVNRFSRDMASIDSGLCSLLRNSLGSVVSLFFRIGAIGSILPIFMVPAACASLAGIVIGEMYTRTAVTVRKLTASSQSPVFSQFSDTLAGLAVIRARSNMPEVFGQLLADRLRVWCRAQEAFYNTNRWVAMRVDFVTAVVSLSAGIIALTKAGSLPAGLVAFSLTNATGLSQTILGLVRSMNDLEVELQSVSPSSLIVTQ